MLSCGGEHTLNNEVLVDGAFSPLLNWLFTTHMDAILVDFLLVTLHS